MSNNITELISTIISELRKVATTETIVGESVKLGDKMVVPVSRVTVGFGAGGGKARRRIKAPVSAVVVAVVPG